MLDSTEFFLKVDIKRSSRHLFLKGGKPMNLVYIKREEGQRLTRVAS